LLGLVAAALAVVFFVPTRHGTLRVEINDPQIVATISGEKVVLAKAANGRDISLSPGERTLTVERGDLRFHTDRFEIRSGDTLTLRVELLEGKVVVRDDRKELGSQTLPPPGPAEPKQPVAPAPTKPKLPFRVWPNTSSTDQQLAQYLQRIGGRPTTSTGNLNDPNLKLTAVRWPQGDEPVDEQLAPFASLQHVELLSLQSRRITNIGFDYCKGFATLKRLELCYSGVDGDAARQLAKYPLIEFLQPPFLGADAWLAEAVNMPKLSELYLNRCHVTDDGLKPLIGMIQLRRLVIMECRFLTAGSLKHLEQLRQLETLVVGKVPGIDDDPAAVERLRKALPNCKVN
jgi:hypothetical protein